MKRVLSIVLVALLLLVSLAGCAQKGADNQKKTYKVALIMSGPITDGSWNASGYKGLMDAKDKYGVETTYVENVAQADAESTFREYASQGYDLVIGHGDQFTDAATKVAATFPKVMFAIINSSAAVAPNLASFRFQAVDLGFMTGAIAALVSKTGKVGIIGGTDMPVIADAVKGFQAGAKYANPNIQTTYAYVGSLTDAAKAKEIAATMYDSGVDVIQNNANQGGAGILEEAKTRKGAMVIGNVSDQSSLAPDNVVTSGLQNIPVLIDMAVDKVVNGQFEAQNFKLGFKEGALDIAPYHNFDSQISQDVKDKIQQIKADIIAGKLDSVIPR